MPRTKHAGRQEPRRHRSRRGGEKTEHSREPPPVPKASRREGIPQKGAPPHGEEVARPKDSGRHGA